MTPSGTIIPLAEPLPLPAPVWLFWFLLTLTFVVHLIAMNLLVGGSIIATVARLRHRASAPAGELVRWFVRAAPVLVAATVTFGVAPLLFLQVLYGRLFFVSSVLMAWSWLLVVPALIVVYYTTYALAARAADLSRRTPVWAHAMVVALLLAVAFVYTNNMTLMLRPSRFAAMYHASAAGLHLNLDDPTLAVRWLHMILGGIAVAGFAVAALGIARSSTEPEFGAWARGYGARWAAVATAVNTLVGSVWVAVVPLPILGRFVAGSALNGGIFIAAFVVGLATAGMMIMLTLPHASPRFAVTSGGGLLATIVLMVLARDQLRRAALETAGFAPVTWTAPQWPIIGLFAICLVAAIAIVTWMVVTLAQATRSGTGGDRQSTPATAWRRTSAA